MTNSIATWLGLLLLGAALFDFAFNDARISISIARAFVRMIVSLRFWV